MLIGTPTQFVVDFCAVFCDIIYLFFGMFNEDLYIIDNDSDRSGTYGTTTDVMECLEVVNTTDHEVDLNNEYQLVYFIKEGQRKVIELCHYDEASESHVGSSENCVIPAGGTAVIWSYKQSYISDYTVFPTEQDLRTTYGIGDNVPVYIFTNQNGVGNTNRGFGIYKLNEDGSKEAISTYDKKLLRVNKSRTGSRKDVTMQITTPKTKSSNRKIPINDFVIGELKAQKQRQEDYAKLLGNGYDKSHNFIVRTVLGKPYVNLSAINRVVNRLTENAGLPHCTIHGFRHSVASILDDNGVPIQDISVLLGHESVNTTERIYINRRKTAKEATINTLDSAINLNIA